MPVPRLVLGSAAVAVALVAAGCGGEDATASTDGPTIVATTAIWADVTANVACDGLAEVVALVPPGADPHAYEPSLADRGVLEDAALVAANGLDLEASLVATIDDVEADGVPVFHFADHVEVLGADAPEEEGADHDDGGDDHGDEADNGDAADHDHDGGDPHIWMDPTRVASAVGALADALIEVGLDEDAVTACADAYRDELTAADRDAATALDAVAPERRTLVTNHDSLGYFADRYAFEIVGTVIPSTSSMAETNPADLEELAGVLDATGAPAIFAEDQLARADIDALAERVGGVEVVTLYTDALGEEGSGAATYVELIRTDAAAVADALG